MPDEAREFALLCPRCGEENPPEFPVCWSCHAALPADRRPKKEQAAVQELEEPPDPLRRKRIALELGVAILVIWVPGLVGGIWRAVEPQPPQGTVATLWGLLHVAGILALLAYFAWLDGDWRQLLGLERPRIWKELAWGAAAFVAVLVAHHLASRITLVLGLDQGPVQGYRLAPEARWLAPFDFALHALNEEVFFRAYLWRRFTELTRRPTLSLVIASALFSAAHVYPISYSISVLFFGLTFAAFFRTRPSVWPLVLAHWAFNLFVAAG